MEMLQSEVTLLRERLDYLASRMSLMLRAQDLLLSLESEAHLQLLRFQQRGVSIKQGGEGGEPLSALLQVFADLLLSLQDERSPPAPCAPCDTSRESEPWQSPQAFPYEQSPQASQAFPSFPSQGHGGPDGYDFGGLSNTLELRGVPLGRGTWANAYRQAVGERREALRLLCTLGIVTEHELANDLTVIPQDHVEECVEIAREILHRWPSASGPPPQEAKSFFQARLEAMYRHRAPVPY